MKKLTIVLLSCLLSSSLIAQNFQEITGTPFEGVDVSSIAFADIDNDNDQDVLITGYNGGECISKIYTNDGSGYFEEVLDTPFEGVNYSSIAFADIDNDNDQDVLITGNSEDGRISKLYTNDGNGNYSEVLGSPFDGVSSGSIAFADVDNDNDQDVLITGNFSGWYTHISKLYTNDGNGNFIEVADTPFEGVVESSIAFADVDNDSDQDVLITGGGGIREPQSSADLYVNDGNGNFELDTVPPFYKVNNGSIAFADIDNDGDQDVLITGSGIAKLYNNNGNGEFEEVYGTPFAGVKKSSTAFADIDNDGDQDVLITGRGEWDGSNYEKVAKLYRNFTIVGINENALFSNVSIFPNPNTGIINIDLGSLSGVSIKVISVNGQLIYYKENINTPIYQFELEAASGIYILELSAEGEKQQIKLIKQ